MKAKESLSRTFAVLPVVLVAVAVAMAAVAILSGSGLGSAYAEETSPPTVNVSAWGYNYSGQLGDGTVPERGTTNGTGPVQVSGLSGVKDVAGGCAYSLAVKDDGTVWAWGTNYFGQLGDGTTTDRTTPVQVSGLSNVKDVASGCYNSLALKDDGTVWAWGSNGWGQLGDGTTTNRLTPVQVGGLTSVKNIAGGWYHSLAVKDDGTVWAWGSNEYGQLGNATTTYRTSPVQVDGLSGVNSVAGGARHSLAVKDDGTAWAWGDNYSGQLGNGTRDYFGYAHPTPVQVMMDDGTGGLSGVKDVAAGGRHSLALKVDGTVFAWGDNGYGQLGAGYVLSSGVSTSAIQVREVSWPIVFLKRVVGVSGGAFHSLALKDDGTVLTWGSTYGHGSNDNNTTPVLVDGLSGATGLAAGKGDVPNFCYTGTTYVNCDGYHNLAVTTTDTTQFTEDKSAPLVTSVFPAGGATGADRQISIVARFSEPIDPATLTTSTVTLVKDGTTTPISARVSYYEDANYNTVSLSPPYEEGFYLDANTKYTVKIKGGTDGVKDLAGNQLGGGNQASGDYWWSFTTGTLPAVEDTIAPKIVSVVPSENAKGVAPATNVTATFSEEMLASSIKGATFKLFKKGSTTPITATVNYPDPNSPPYTTAKLDPINSLQSGATYKAVVTTAAKDLAGNPLPQQYSWFFTVSKL